jgi:hypothetical protein
MVQIDRLIIQRDQPESPAHQTDHDKYQAETKQNIFFVRLYECHGDKGYPTCHVQLSTEIKSENGKFNT